MSEAEVITVQLYPPWLRGQNLLSLPLSVGLLDRSSVDLRADLLTASATSVNPKRPLTARFSSCTHVNENLK